MLLPGLTGLDLEILLPQPPNDWVLQVCSTTPGKYRDYDPISLMKQLDLLFCLTLQILFSEPLILPGSHNPTDNIPQDLVKTLAYHRQIYMFSHPNTTCTSHFIHSFLAPSSHADLCHRSLPKPLNSSEASSINA